MHGNLTMAKRQFANDFVTITPELAQHYLEHNQHNRPISDSHVRRIALQIKEGKWKFNGDTIKIAETGDVLDGQHRLWAIITSEIPVETIVVTGIEKDAFATIDTLRKPRSAADLVALKGQVRHRNVLATALTWLVRWQRKDDKNKKASALPKYKEPQFRIENSDVEAAYEAHGQGMLRAVEKAVSVRGVANPGLLAFIYYITANQNVELAEQFIAIMESPGRLAASHPLFQLRNSLLREKDEPNKRRREPVTILALCIKALNATHSGNYPKLLNWVSTGPRAEIFPVLNVKK
jgi:hypothetical protein